MSVRLPSALFAALCVGLAGAALAAPKIDRIEVSAQPATVGQPVRITVHAVDVDDTPCAVQMDFGDGQKDRPQKLGGKYPTFPRVWEHSYAQPGKYTVVAEGSRAGNVFGCVATARYDLNVEPAPAAGKKGAAKSDVKSPCPQDWALKGKVGKGGEFTCVPAKGVAQAAKPEKGLACPAGTDYFTKGKTLGCEKP